MQEHSRKWLLRCLLGCLILPACAILQPRGHLTVLLPVAGQVRVLSQEWVRIALPEGSIVVVAPPGGARSNSWREVWIDPHLRGFIRATSGGLHVHNGSTALLRSVPFPQLCYGYPRTPLMSSVTLVSPNLRYVILHRYRPDPLEPPHEEPCREGAAEASYADRGPYIVDTYTSRIVKYEPTEAVLAITDGGDRYGIRYDGDLVLRQLSGRSEVVAKRVARFGLQSDSHASLSLDGRRLLFLGTGGGTYSWISVFHFRERRFQRLHEPYDRLDSPVFSASGKKVAFVFRYRNHKGEADGEVRIDDRFAFHVSDSWQNLYWLGNTYLIAVSRRAVAVYDVEKGRLLRAPAPPRAPVRADAAPTADELKRGRELYESPNRGNCAACHGQDGRPTEVGYILKARDLQNPAAYKQGPGVQAVAETIRRGVTGGPTMPPRPDLSEEERLLIAMYVVSLRQK